MKFARLAILAYVSPLGFAFTTQSQCFQSESFHSFQINAAPHSAKKVSGALHAAGESASERTPLSPMPRSPSLFRELQNEIDAIKEERMKLLNEIALIQSNTIDTETTIETIENALEPLITRREKMAHWEDEAQTEAQAERWQSGIEPAEKAAHTFTEMVKPFALPPIITDAAAQLMKDIIGPSAPEVNAGHSLVVTQKKPKFGESEGNGKSSVSIVCVFK